MLPELKRSKSFHFVRICLVFLLPGAGLANICDEAALAAADRTGVPADVLRTITRVETAGYQGQADPWPWAINHAGDGSYFQSEDAARSYVFSKVKSGATNIDIGCFQINYRWHSGAFQSLDDMFDPMKNALYAAGFLDQLHREFGNWTDAAGAYHSRTPKFAERYKARFAQLRTQLEPAQPVQPAGLFARRVQSSSGARSNGSLFVQNSSSSRPLFDIGGN